MQKPQFEIRTLLAITALIAFALAFTTHVAGWVFALLLTVLLANVTCVIVALVYFVLLPLLQKDTEEQASR
ncbi:MAG: hypothetical protein AB8B55_06605 [Mariniblastus sp.]